ncbi:MAG: hypothetical protein V3W51_04655 [Candidatus Brocadiales bacterium]
MFDKIEQLDGYSPGGYMPWIKLEDSFPDHPKVVEVGPLAAWLYICGLCYCNRYLTDGLIPTTILDRLSGVENIDTKASYLAELLVKHGLWEEEGNSYRVHNYLLYQSSKEEVLRIKELRTEAGRRGGLAKGKQSAKQNPSKHSSKTLVKEEGGGVGGGEEVRSKKKEVRTPPHPPPPLLTEQEMQRLLEKYGTYWSSDVIKEIIADAFSHNASKKRGDKYAYVNNWLRREAEQSQGRSRPDGRGKEATPTSPSPFAKYSGS